MGWTGIPMGARPRVREQNRIIGERLEHERCRIVDRSGWLDHGRRQFLLLEVDPAPIHQHVGPKRFILMVSVDFANGMFLYREESEDMGPNQADCPMRLINQLEGHPPINEYSERWRERVAAHHRSAGPRKSVLRKLQKGEQENLVLLDGRTVSFQMARHRGRRISAYRDPGTGTLTVLRAGAIDPEASRELWQRDEKGEE